MRPVSGLHDPPIETSRNRITPNYDDSSSSQNLVIASLNTDFSHKNSLVCSPNTRIDRYELLFQLGHGSFGETWLARDLETDEEFCFKIIKSGSCYQTQGQLEASALDSFSELADHFNIIKLYDHFIFKNRLILKLERLSTSFYDLIANTNHNGVSLKLVKKLSVDLLISLIFLESRGLVHADIKPENVMLIKPKRPKAKLIDFGSLTLESEGKSIYYVQSRYYRAPEVVMGCGLSCKADIWSFGCVLAELHLGKPLFPGLSEIDLLRKIFEVLGTPPLHILNHGSDKRRNSLWVSAKGLDLGGWGTINFVQKAPINSNGKMTIPPGINTEVNEYPLKERRLWRLLQTHKNQNRNEFNSNDDELMLQFYDLLSSTLNLDPEFRLSAVELAKLPFFSEYEAYIVNSCLSDEVTANYCKTFWDNSHLINAKVEHNNAVRTHVSQAWRVSTDALDHQELDGMDRLRQTEINIENTNCEDREAAKSNRNFIARYLHWKQLV